MKRPRLSCAMLLAAALIAMAAGCKSYPVRTIPTTPVASLAAKEAVGEVTVAAEPVWTADQSKAIFNFPITDKGFLPVLIVIENRSNLTYELLRDRVELIPPTGERLNPVDAKVMASSFGRNAMAEAIFLFGIFSYDDARKYNDAMVDDWDEKALKEAQLIAPGRTLRRYAYFRTGPGEPQGGTLSVGLSNPSTNQVETATVKIAR